MEEEAPIYAQPERRPSTDGAFSADSSNPGRKQSSSSEQLLRFQQEDHAATMPGKGGGSPNKYDVAKSKDGRTVKCVVQLLDGSDFETQVDPKCTGQMLLDKVCEHVNLLEKDYFCCTYMTTPDVKVWIQNDRPLSKQINKGKWNFSFDVKFYPQDPTALHEEITRYQVYLQLRKDIYLGRLPASFVTLALLGSYAVQSQIGDFDIDEHGPEIDYIKGKHFCPNQTEDLLEKIAELHRTHSGQIPPEAEFHFLENAKNLALYGVHQHQALNEAKEEVYVGICAAGLLIYRQRIRLGRYIWVKILKIAYKRNRFSIIIRSDPGEGKAEKTVVFSLPNYKAAKRLWRLAVEHHTFFRLREPEQMARGLFSRRSYYAGRTQYQSRQATDQIERQGQDFNRVYYTVGRGKGGGGLDDVEPPAFSTDHSEETLPGLDYRTMTLDLKRKGKYSTPGGDMTDAGSNIGPSYYGSEKDGGGVTLLVGPGDGLGGVAYSKTPYPTGPPGYFTPGGEPGFNTPGYGTGYQTPGGTNYGGSRGGSPFFGMDDLQRQHTGSPDDPNYYQGSQSMARYGASANAGAPGTGQTVNEYGNPVANKNVHITHTTRIINGRPVDDDAMGGYQDDHLKQQGVGYGGPNDGTWGLYSNASTTKTMTRTYTAPDGTIVTEHRTEKNGVVETHIEKRTQMADDIGDIDYDKALADAIKSVTDINTDLTVEKIEIHAKEGD